MSGGNRPSIADGGGGWLMLRPPHELSAMGLAWLCVVRALSTNLGTYLDPGPQKRFSAVAPPGTAETTVSRAGQLTGTIYTDAVYRARKSRERSWTSR